MSKTPRNQYADASNPGLLSTGAQTVAGVKTFASAIAADISKATTVAIGSTTAGVDITTHSTAGDDFTVNTNKLVVKGDTGFVGIGTASPAVALDVVGRIQASDAITSATGYIVKAIRAAGVANNGTLTLLVTDWGGYVGTLYVSNGSTVGLNNRTTSVYHTSARFTGGKLLSQISTINGNSGMSFTIAQDGNNQIVVTNTCGQNTDISIMFVGCGIG